MSDPDPTPSKPKVPIDRTEVILATINALTELGSRFISGLTRIACLAIPWAGIGFTVVFSARELAGQDTSVILGFLNDKWSDNKTITISATVNIGLAYTYYKSRAHFKSTEERKNDYIAILERKLDQNRTSSELNKDGSYELDH